MHDRIFKGLLRAFLSDFLHLVAPQVAERLDFSPLTFLDKELFTAGRRRELDLLAKVPLRGRSDDFLLVHVEVEARATRAMGDRLWSYRNQVQAAHDCRVLPIVVNIRRGRPGVHLETRVDEVLGPELGAFPYLAFGLAGCAAAEYLARPEPLAWALAALMDPGDLSRAGHKLACLRRIAGAPLGDAERFLLVNCVESYLQLNPSEAAEYEALGSLRENREIQTMAMTWAERMVAKGRNEGRQEGRQEGQQQGARQVVLHLLDERFGTVPERVRRQVEQIDSVDRLTSLASRVLSARSLEEIGLG